MGKVRGVGLLAVIHFLAWTGVARADVFVLNQGGRIEGVWLNPDESPRISYQVQTGFGGRLTLQSEQVERVMVKSEAERKYEAFLPKVPDTAEGHWDAAQRCIKAGLDAQRDFHLEQVLRLDPNHAEARKLLGYHQSDGHWVRQQDVMTQRGYIRQGGNWKLPQEIELEKFAGGHEQATGEYRKKLKLWAEWITKARGKQAEGEAAIRGIKDPEASEALLEMLLDQKQPRPLRLLYLEVLSQMPNNASQVACSRIAIEDPDATLRDHCLDYLSERHSQYALKYFIQMLKNEQNATVHRAAFALAKLKDPAATMPLIDALITEHKEVVGGGGINPSFSNQGGGLSMGGSPKVVKRKIQNDPVLGALTVLYPGVNFQFDQQAWRRWYSEQFTPKQVNLRRSD